MNNKLKNNLIFDWSGVISNDIDPVLKTYNHMFAKYGIAPLSYDEFKNRFVLPYEIFCKDIMGDSIQLDILQDEFREIYTRLNEPPKLIPGVKDILLKLHEKDIKMTVLSSHSFVTREAEAYFPGKNFFAKIYEDIPDKTHCIDTLLTEQDFDPCSTFYVGDMTHDIETGKFAGVKTIAITTGYQSRQTLKTADPDYIVDDMSQILSILAIN